MVGPKEFNTFLIHGTKKIEKHRLGITNLKL